jgi:hypothetical protein
MARKPSNLRTRMKRWVRRTMGLSQTERLHALVIGRCMKRDECGLRISVESTPVKHLQKIIVLIDYQPKLLLHSHKTKVTVGHAYASSPAVLLRQTPYVCSNAPDQKPHGLFRSWVLYHSL